MQQTLSSQQPKSIKNTLLILGIIFVAFNLRPSITAIGPLIGDIRLDTGISNSLAGLLTTLPLLAFAGLSLLTPKLARKFGNEATVMIGLILLAVGIFIRPTDFISLLFFGTLLVGSGIAICNVLLPGIVKQKFAAKVGLMTGMYTLAMSGAASIGSGVSVPMAHGLNLGWKGTLIAWGVLTIVAMIVWIPQLRKKKADEHQNVKLPNTQAKTSVWRSKIAWQVTIFMGLQSLLFYCLIAWLPEILYSRGLSLSASGWMVSILQIVGLPSTMLAPYIADRLTNQRMLMLVMGIVYFTGLTLLLVGDHLVVLSISVILVGVSQGASIGLSLTLLSLRARDAKQASNLSGMAQSVGYLLAATGPFAIGMIFDIFHSWDISLFILLIVCLFMTLAGIGAGRDEYVTPAES
ncbi:CynX/NimT family MFS transporter [Alkalibacillus aidingensis]|uniref:CynX/NimT family MFS transporter n=1 Tax=Alkalibacillus aidingensis TaxID=2747607 RepID=UPI001660218D|nr:MFS transporter [Alkalibacillus aidingensis]